MFGMKDKRTKLREEAKKLGMTGYSSLRVADLEAKIAEFKKSIEEKGAELPENKNSRVEKIVLAAITIEENKDDTPHKFQVIRDGDSTGIERTEDSKGQNVCRGRTTWATDGLLHAVELVTSDAAKKAPAYESKHEAVAVTKAAPKAVVAGNSELALSRDDGNVIAEVSGYSFQFAEDDLLELAELLSDELIVTTASASASA